MKRFVAFTYDRITEESASEGEAAEYGWADLDGGRYPIGGSEVPEEDLDEETDAEDVGVEVKDAREAADLIRDNLNAVEPSSSQFHPGVWYSDADDRQDYEDGDAERLAAHLHGFDPRQERAIWNELVGRRHGRAHG